MSTLLGSLGKTFEELVALAESDPAAFEAWRQATVEALVTHPEDTDRERRMRGLQFRLDLTRSLAKNPLAACVKLNSMMWDSHMALAEALSGFPAPKPVERPQPRSEAVVIEFRPR